VLTGSRAEREGMVRDMFDRRLAGSGPWQVAGHGQLAGNLIVSGVWALGKMLSAGSRCRC